VVFGKTVISEVIRYGEPAIFQLPEIKGPVIVVEAEENKKVKMSSVKK
jgi:hypothetical protein